jgi:hypothetical protein
LPLQAAQAQSYALQVLADTNTPRPDGQGNFNIAWPLPAAFEGSAIAFVNFGASDQEYWIANPDTHTFTKLLDTSTPAPGGNGPFSNFYPPNNNLSSLRPQIQNGILYFWAEDQNGSTGYGLYWIRTSGGDVHRVVNYKTPLPEGGMFDFINSYTVGGALVLVNTNTGVFAISPKTGAVTVVADSSTQIPIAGTSGYYSC